MFFSVVAVSFMVNLQVFGCTAALALVAIAPHYLTPHLFPVGRGEEALVSFFVGLAFTGEVRHGDYQGFALYVLPPARTNTYFRYSLLLHN